MADSKGYYTQAGFSKVDLVTGPVDSADALVVAGNVTVGVSAPDATARFITEQGAPLKIIGATFQKNPFCILSIEQGKPIRTLADLAGKTVGIQAGTNQQIFAGFLKANGIDPASVKQVVVQYEPTPLTEKKVDGFMAFLTNEPFLVKQQGFTPVTLAFADNGLPLASETLVVLQDTIDKDRDKLKAFLKAEIQGGTTPSPIPRRWRSSPSRPTGRTSSSTWRARPSRPRPRTSWSAPPRRRPTGCSRSATPRWRRTSSRSARWASPSPPTSSSTSAWSRRSTRRTRA
jgi:hypothetical protein